MSLLVREVRSTFVLPSLRMKPSVLQKNGFPVLLRAEVVHFWGCWEEPCLDLRGAGAGAEDAFEVLPVGAAHLTCPDAVLDTVEAGHEDSTEVLPRFRVCIVDDDNVQVGSG